MPDSDNDSGNDAGNDAGRQPQHDPSQSQTPRVEESSPQQVSVRIEAIIAAQNLPQQQLQGSLPQESGPSTATASPDLSANSSNQQRPRNVNRMERDNFLLFIKILFKVLEDDPTVRSRAQRIVMECRRQNQSGDPNYIPLMAGVERHLRVFVGEPKWRRSTLLLHHYIVNKRGAQPGSTNRERPSAILVGK
jgi:hypothetical protein